MVNTTTPCPHHAKMMMSTENNNKTMLHNDNHDGHHKMLYSTTDHNLHDGMIVSLFFFEKLFKKAVSKLISKPFTIIGLKILLCLYLMIESETCDRQHEFKLIRRYVAS